MKGEESHGYANGDKYAWYLCLCGVENLGVKLENLGSNSENSNGFKVLYYKPTDQVRYILDALWQGESSHKNSSVYLK